MLYLLSAWSCLFGPQTEFDINYTETVSIVQVPLKISRQGRPLKNVDVDKLELRENGVRVNIRGIEQLATGSTIQLLFDLSASQEKHLNNAKRLARDLIVDSGDRVRIKIASFSAYYRGEHAYTNDHEQLLKQLEPLNPRGSTALYDGLAAALQDLATQDGLRLLVVFADGQDFASTIKEQQLWALSRSYGLPIFVLSATKPPKSAYLLWEQRKFMETLSTESGGGFFTADGTGLRHLQRWLKQHSQRFQISYAPPNPEDDQLWRSITITYNNCDDCLLEYKRAFTIHR